MELFATLNKMLFLYRTFDRVIHAFITSCLDYCSALYFGVRQAALSHLQLVQNASAHLLTRSYRHEHITPVLAPLPVSYKIDFKTVFKCSNSLASHFLSDPLQPCHPLLSIRSSNQLLLAVPRLGLNVRGYLGFLL